MKHDKSEVLGPCDLCDEPVRDGDLLYTLTPPGVFRHATCHSKEFPSARELKERFDAAHERGTNALKALRKIIEK